MGQPPPGTPINPRLLTPEYRKAARDYEASMRPVLDAIHERLAREAEASAAKSEEVVHDVA